MLLSTPLRASCWRFLLPLVLLLLALGTARAQTPPWTSATVAGNLLLTGSARTWATTTNAAGEVLVTGYFNGAVNFGATTLTSAGSDDLFLAKYVPLTGSWVWAIRLGGGDYDRGYGVAVSGSSIYVAGLLTNNSANGYGISMQGSSPGTGSVPVAGASYVYSYDMVLAKYTDLGAQVVPVWAQVGGGRDFDQGAAVAVSGSSVYVAGTLTNSQSDVDGVLFGGNGTVLGTRRQYGVSATENRDLLLVKYTDLGATGSYVWSQVGGGDNRDYAEAVAVNGSSVYIAGSLFNNQSNVTMALFGGSGTTLGTVPVRGASTTNGQDLLLAKYTDSGPSASFGWAQVGGGTGVDHAYGLTTSGSSVYVVGTIENDNANAYGVLLGGNGTTVGTYRQAGASNLTSPDLLLAKYTDNGPSASLGWAQVGGGTSADVGLGVAASGSSVYVTGYTTNNAANAAAVLLGGSGLTPGTSTVLGASAGFVSSDLLLANYTDSGPGGTLRWAQVGGGPGVDSGYAVTLAGQQVSVGGLVTPPATFGNIALATPNNIITSVLARINDPTLTPLAARASAPGPGLALYPNPSPGAATLVGATPGATVQVLDALGRQVATATADAAGTAALSGLAPGLYLVRAGAGSARLAVE